MEAIATCTLRLANFLYITNPLWKHAPRNADSRHNLLFVTEGVLYIEVEGERYTVHPGEFLYLPHAVPSVGYRPSGEPTGIFFAIFDTPSRLDLPTCFGLPDTADIRAMYAALIRASRSAEYPAAGVNALLHSLLYAITYHLAHRLPTDEETLAAQIRKYAAETVSRNLNVQDIAAHFGRCPDYINRVFSRAEHITLGAYIIRLKLDRIEECLMSRNTPINVIARQLNFSSPSAFTKFYKYHTGKTPEAYRAELDR